MTAMQHTASLSEPAVQRAARNELDELSQRRQRASETRPRTTRAVVKVETHKLVRQLAEAIASDNVHGYSRVELVDESTAIVR